MKKTIKKIAASIMAATVLVVGMTSVSASASTSASPFYDSKLLCKYAGSPSNAGSLDIVWNYTTYYTTSTITISNFTSTDSRTNIFAYIAINGDIKSASTFYPSSGSVSARNLDKGDRAYAGAQAEYYGGDFSATASIVG